MAASNDELLASSQPLSAADAESMRFRRQWLITRRTDTPAVDWPRVALNERHVLHHHPDARLLRVGGDVGCIILGVPLADGGMDRLTERLAAVAGGSPDELRRLLHGLAGTYVLVRFTPDDVTLYTDPAGMMGVFEGHGRVASTPPLLGELERDVALDAQFPFKADNDWYPGRLTPFRGVTALLPNHSLHVETGMTQRFWPLEDAPRIDAHEGVQRLATILRRNVVAATEQGSVICSVTGGKDSRVNVAALRPVINAAGFFTIRGDFTRACDVEIPKEMARSLGLDHRFVDNRPAPGWLTRLYDEMTNGLSIGGRREMLGAVNQLAGSRRIHMNGNLGGIAKSYFWHSRRPEEVRQRSLAKEFVHKPPRIRTAVGHWLDSLPDLAPTTIYNLMYLEQRGGRWVSVGETASSLFYDSVTPLCSREVFELICQMPTQAQFGGTLLPAVVRDMWPELGQIPYCPARRNFSRHIPRPVKSTLKAAAASLRGRG